MIEIDLYDWSCSDLILTYVDLHYNDFCQCNIEDDISCLEYCDRNFFDFRDWAESMGYKITRSTS